MATAGMVGYGAKLEYDATGYVEVIEVRDMSLPDINVSDVDFGSQDSTSGIREFKAGLCDSGQVEVSMILGKAQYNTLKGFLRTTKVWKITLSDNSYFGFSGFLVNLDDAVPYEDAVTCTMTIEITGAVVFTAA